MNSQQIVDYIKTQTTAGHSEATLRKHLQAHGWSSSDIDRAFQAYQAQSKPRESKSQRSTSRPSKLVRRGQRPAKRGRKLRFLFRLAVIAAALILGYVAYQLFWPGAQEAPPKPVVHALTPHERQTLDVNTVAGAIAQYTAANGGVLPTRLSAGSDTSLIMCNNVCNPTTSQVASLTTYKAANVKIMIYTPSLAVPDANTIYLVARAKCASNGSIGSTNPNPRSMVLLYVRSTDTTPERRCLVL